MMLRYYVIPMGEDSSIPQGHVRTADIVVKGGYEYGNCL
jgi:hypothetical protein